MNTEAIAFSGDFENKRILSEHTYVITACIFFERVSSSRSTQFECENYQLRKILVCILKQMCNPIRKRTKCKYYSPLRMQLKLRKFISFNTFCALRKKL